MTINEILKAKGISDETVADILAAMKENKIFTAGEENLDIRYGKLKTQMTRPRSSSPRQTRSLKS